MKFGVVPCEIQSVQYWEIKCTTGPNAAGLVDVVVSSGCNDLGCEYMYNNGFTYDDTVQPRITSLHPTSGPTYGGLVLTITGTSFPVAGDEVKVSLGGKSCEVQSTSSSQVTCLVPSNPPGDGDVVVDTKNQGESFWGAEILLICFFKIKIIIIIIHYHYHHSPSS